MSAILTLAALAAIDPAFQSRVEITPAPEIKLKPHQMRAAHHIEATPAQKVRRINQPAARGTAPRNEPCRRA